MTECPVCWRNFHDDCGQAASVREHGRCLACCVAAEKLNGFAWNVDRVQANRTAYLAKQGESKEEGQP